MKKLCCCSRYNLLSHYWLFLDVLFISDLKVFQAIVIVVFWLVGSWLKDLMLLILVPIMIDLVFWPTWIILKLIWCNLELRSTAFTKKLHFVVTDLLRETNHSLRSKWRYSSMATQIEWIDEFLLIDLRRKILQSHCLKCSHIVAIWRRSHMISFSLTWFKMLWLNAACMIRNPKLIKIGGTKFDLVFEVDQILQHRSFTALRNWIEFELWFAACLFGSQVLKLCGILEEFGETVWRSFTSLWRLVDWADQASKLLKTAQSAFTYVPVAELGTVLRLRKIQDHAQLSENLFLTVRL